MRQVSNNMYRLSTKQNKQSGILYLLYYNAMFSAGKEIIKIDSHAIEDIINEVFLNYLKIMDSIRSPKTYLVTSVRNRCRNFIRDKKFYLPNDVIDTIKTKERY